MTALTLPPWFGADGFSLNLSTVQHLFASPFGGSEQVLDLLNDRWEATFSVPPRIFPEAAALEAFIASFRGMSNTLAIYHLLRPQPRGTMRGSPTAQAAAAGAGSLTISTTAGATLFAGDMIGVGGLLLQVAADAAADGSGAMPVQIVNRLRGGFAAGTPVVWDRPTAPFRLASKPVVQFVPGYAQGVTFDFVEAIG